MLFYLLIRVSEEKFVAGNFREGARLLARAIVRCSRQHQECWDRVLYQVLKPHLYRMIADAVEEESYSNTVRTIRLFPIEE